VFGACDENESGIDNKYAMRCIPTNGKRKSGRPRTDWIQTAKEDLKTGVASWEQVPALAVESKTWKELKLKTTFNVP